MQGFARSRIVGPILACCHHRNNGRLSCHELAVLDIAEFHICDWELVTKSLCKAFWSRASCKESSHKEQGLRTGSRVFTFGDSVNGALGHGLPPFTDAYEPEEVIGLPAGIASVAAGHYHSMAVSENGELWAWGRNKEGQLGARHAAPLTSNPVQALVSSPEATSALAWATDMEGGGECGTPSLVRGLEGLRIVRAAGSGVVSMAIGADGSLWSWGTSKRGQLGLGRGVIQSALPAKVGGALAHQRVVQVALGWGHALAQTSNGELYSWGYAANGRLGYLDPLLPLARGTAAAITPGAKRIWETRDVIEEAEELVSQAMEREKEAALVWEPRRVEDLAEQRVVQVACGMDHSLVLCENNVVYTFGDNTLQQLGRPALDHPDLPQPITSQPGLEFHCIAAGLSHSLAAARPHHAHPGSVSRTLTWGFNAAYLQNGPNIGSESSLREVKELRGEDVVKVAAGRVHSCALTAAGELLVWGNGKNGRLGLGSSRPEPAPCLVDTLEGQQVLDVACGFDHTLVVTKAVN